ncbi:MAG: DUF2887 domain-containing protein, partial [Verrucomicrobiae bacterium]|nr:DUF2887 domain-containing protein [Verrucomicrobiae bacterium]
RLNSRKGPMHTDKETYQIFRRFPQLLFELAEIDDPGKCSMEAVTVKSLQRSMDGLVRPEDPDQPLNIIEIQFQRADNIYNRIVVEMALVQEANDMRSVRGLIFFASRSLDPTVAPWTTCVQAVMLDEALARREAALPDDPFVAVFKPVFESDDSKLEKEAATHYRHLQISDQLNTDQAETLQMVFLGWFLERFRDRSHKEIAMILDLPDIEDTRAGRELLEKGLEQGLEQGVESSVLLIARKRFGVQSIDKELEAAIRELRYPALEQLLGDLLDLPDLEALRRKVTELQQAD